ncbi:DUF2079 domain-containing protein [Miltoncostaea marina]|uniref:DUF2079 domain-containing protein n=1 Tax=Miltoncostaea marina TaxID=2843215 RepID=UPI001C3C8C0B|nr:DUF2079 domain-containing protein [Miltoncostaea marina]
MSVAPPPPRPAPARRRWRRGPADVALAAVWAMAAAWAGLFAGLSVARHHAFWTGRFDVGNMVQAVWSTAQGRPLETTDIAGRQFSRLGAHVDPILALFTPLAWTGALPEALLVAQAVIVASGALPAFWLGRRWLGDDRLAVAAAAVWLLYPPVGWATVTEFHPVTLAAPLLLFCIWAAEERRPVVLGVCAALAVLCKEEVGLAVALIGGWMVVRGLGRRYGVALALLATAWVAFAVGVVIPRFNDGRPSAFIGRYGTLGDDAGDVAVTLLTRPWEAAEVLWSYDRLSYLGALLLPLALLPLAAPALLAVAAPEVLINVLADWFPQYSIEYQYVAVIAPVAVAAAILGLARVRRARRPALLARAVADPGRTAVAWVAIVALSGVYLGPLPLWRDLAPVGYSGERADQYRGGPHADAMARAVALVPDDVPVSAGNLLGSHLSERERILTFPVVGEAQWVLTDERRPYVGDLLSRSAHAEHLRRLRARGDMRLVFEEDGVMVFRRGAGA